MHRCCVCRCVYVGGFVCVRARVRTCVRFLCAGVVLSSNGRLHGYGEKFTPFDRVNFTGVFYGNAVVLIAAGLYGSCWCPPWLPVCWWSHNFLSVNGVLRSCDVVKVNLIGRLLRTRARTHTHG